MEGERDFLRTVSAIAIPAALQSMLQSSFSVVDQIMIGQLGSVSVAGVGLAGRFASIYSVMVAAVGTVAGIMLSQYLGQKNGGEVRRSLRLNLAVSLFLAGLFIILCAIFPRQIMGLYSTDAPTVRAAGDYLFLVTWTFLPMAGTTLLSTLFRCAQRSELPLYAGSFAALTNTGLNYLLIFGKLGLPALGARGAAIATVCSQWVDLLILLLLCRLTRDKLSLGEARPVGPFRWGQYAAMLAPILVCEFLWSLGENIYAGIYGHMGTDASAAMTLINPVQSLMIGALCGLSQAAGIIVGRRLGRGDREGAYWAAWRLILYGFIGSLALSAVILLIRGAYVELFKVSDQVKSLTRQILVSYALIAPFKVENMIAGGGVVRSGGRTGYVLAIDMLGTWGFGVPLGLLSAFVWRLSIPYVYLILSLEECVRFTVTVAVIRRRGWMNTLQGGEET